MHQQDPEAGLPDDPVELFGRWFDEAETSGNTLPEAMAVATSTPDGQPSVRYVLLKSFDERGFVFFTNYESRKAADLESNPRVAAVLFWGRPRRQVRIEGRVERLPGSESDAYFSTRDRHSQIGAVVSPQSRVIQSRDGLDADVVAMAERCEGQAIERPEHWGGYLIRPDTIEFWIGRENRLHDRFRYRREQGGWVRERLAP